MPDAPRPLPPKKDVALALLEREPSVYIHLDPRRAGVSVPKWFTTQPQLVLQIGMNMPIPIPDLKVDDDGVSCTLSFSRTPFWCRVPWTAIWALVGEDQRGMVWPEDVPPELAAQKQQQKGPQAASQKPVKRPRARLAAVEPDGGDEEARKARPRPRLEAAPAPAGDAGDERFVEEAGAPAQPPAGPRAVPQPAPAAMQRSEEDGKGEGEGEGDEATAGDAPAPRPAGGKPKRELPPYLRVIK